MTPWRGPVPICSGDFVLGIMLASSAPGCLDRWGKMPLAVHSSIILASAALVWASCADTFLVPDVAFSGLIVLAFLSFGIVARAVSPALSERLARWSSGSFFVYCSHIFVLIALTGGGNVLPVPVGTLGLVVPGACRVHAGAERLPVPQTVFPARPRPDDRGK